MPMTVRYRSGHQTLRYPLVKVAEIDAQAELMQLKLQCKANFEIHNNFMELKFSC